MKQLNKLSMIALAASVALIAGCSSSDDGPAPVLESGFNFGTETPDAFTRVDRMGMPAVATALISSKDGYNQANAYKACTRHLMASYKAWTRPSHHAQQMAAELAPAHSLQDHWLYQIRSRSTLQ